MSYQMHSIKVLLVEDNGAMQELVKSLLLSFGITTVFTADTAEKAFDILQRKNPDLVITDWMLKPVDGIELTRKIRTDTRSPNEFVPIIMMTGFCEATRVMHARDCGITEFLVKPFTARDLYRVAHALTFDNLGAVDEDTNEVLLNTILYPALELKSHGTMFQYPMISRAAGDFVRFLEFVKRLNSETLVVIKAYHKIMNMIATGSLPKYETPHGNQMCVELNHACTRYFDDRASPVLSSISMRAPHSDASPLAGSICAHGVFLVKRCIGTCFFAPMTLS